LKKGKKECGMRRDEQDGKNLKKAVNSKKKYKNKK
jgi:hypothetical protein